MDDESNVQYKFHTDKHILDVHTGMRNNKLVVLKASNLQKRCMTEKKLPNNEQIDQFTNFVTPRPNSNDGNGKDGSSDDSKSNNSSATPQPNSNDGNSKDGSSDDSKSNNSSDHSGIPQKQLFETEEKMNNAKNVKKRKTEEKMNNAENVKKRKGRK